MTGFFSPELKWITTILGYSWKYLETLWLCRNCLVGPQFFFRRNRLKNRCYLVSLVEEVSSGFSYVTIWIKTSGDFFMNKENAMKHLGASRYRGPHIILSAFVFKFYSCVWHISHSHMKVIISPNCKPIY